MIFVKPYQPVGKFLNHTDTIVGNINSSGGEMVILAHSVFKLKDQVGYLARQMFYIQTNNLEQMKNFIKLRNCLAFVAAIAIVSCQNEENNVNQENPEALTTNAPLTGLLQRVAMVETSADDVIDSTSCFHVELPYNVNLNDQPILVDSESDYETIAENFDASYPDYNTVDFVFPITVVYPDYSEVVVESQSEFESLSFDCQDAVPADESPIACLSINYPITILAYDSNYQVATSYGVGSDAELFNLLSNLEVSQYYAIDYPIALQNSEGNTINVSSNEQLQDAIETAVEDCLIIEEACVTVDTPFIAIYDSIKALPEVAESTIWSAETHEYTFSTNTDGTICSIGYQGDEGFTGVEYLIEIVAADGSVIYSGIHTFSSDATEYVSIPPVNIAANQLYCIRRTLPGGGGLCRVVMSTGVEPILPASNGYLTIHSSRYFGGGTGSDEPVYHVLAHIGIAFNPN